MKKIIELAEKATGDNKDAMSAYFSYLELKKAIEERRKLEQTPITEDWLEKHGFYVSNELHSKRDKIYIKEDVKVHLDVDVETGVVGNADCIEIITTFYTFGKSSYGCDFTISLADLYDALELCNIQID